MEEVQVVIVGAGPAGLATSACLNHLKIPNVVLEREDCYASLWKKKSYDRLKLHLAKEFCELPYMPYPSNAPTYIPKDMFVQYLDNYVSQFKINPKCNRSVKSAFFDANVEKWRVTVENILSGEQEMYLGKFLVVASGENSVGYIPHVQGLDGFKGEAVHSSKYENGRKYSGKNVLVVGSGNSGMEIAYDLSNSGANTSIVVRSPVHVLNKEIVHFGMVLLKFIPLKIVDKVVVRLGKLKYGNLSKFGIRRPKEGPFYLKATKGRSATIDVGCIKKIKTAEIKVLPSITSIDGNLIKFANGNYNWYDAIIFATGYSSSVLNWFKVCVCLIFFYVSR
ncbi:indole-3-pyruvate monooxygenase YUCCA10 [Pyrus ussuriensis x Pyrus communis]|uniref:indole-3-pyruvate monooxygenase n=1 Tax=Pyrus ussuriensis x Pyrus communis TaxID=2448454 RepID=A0A5N5FL23_9ROSA|nr:indole-3-pyruvate monooxygenase YUCCA10 [Pyrus ussuriensis x Pyrus communis]